MKIIFPHLDVHDVHDDVNEEYKVSPIVLFIKIELVLFVFFARVVVV